MKHLPLSASSLLPAGLFCSLDEGLRATIAGNCSGYLFEVGEVILSCEDTGSDVYFILAGAVHITTFSISGKEVTFRDQCAGDMFGLLSAIDGQPRSAHVVAREAASIACMGYQKFNALLCEHPAINNGVLRHMATLIRSLSERVTEYGTLSVNQRICAESLMMARTSEVANNAARISPVPTHADLASRIATHREAVTRELKQLTVSGVVEKQSGALLIKDMAALKSLLLDAS